MRATWRNTLSSPNGFERETGWPNLCRPNKPLQTSVYNDHLDQDFDMIATSISPTEGSRVSNQVDVDLPHTMDAHGLCTCDSHFINCELLPAIALHLFNRIPSPRAMLLGDAPIPTHCQMEVSWPPTPVPNRLPLTRLR